MVKYLFNKTFWIRIYVKVLEAATKKCSPQKFPRKEVKNLKRMDLNGPYK